MPIIIGLIGSSFCYNIFMVPPWNGGDFHPSEFHQFFAHALLPISLPSTCWFMELISVFLLCSLKDWQAGARARFCRLWSKTKKTAEQHLEKSPGEKSYSVSNELIAVPSCWATFSKTTPAVNRRSHHFLFFARTLHTDYDANLLHSLLSF